MAYILYEQNTALAARCPHCSRGVDVTNTRIEGERHVAFHDMRKVPEYCDGCGSPMDADKAQAYQDKMAVLQNGTPAEKQQVAVKTD